MFSNRKVTAIIVAAGTSKRMDGLDKLFARLYQKPLIYWSVVAFENNSKVDNIVIVSSDTGIKKINKMINRYNLTKVKHVIPGGARRQDSVKAGLIFAEGSGWVLIHDGARPLVGQDIINSVLEKAMVSGAAIPAIPVNDTIKTVRKNQVSNTLPRNNLFAAQTPQAFSYDIITRAFEMIDAQVTDDAQMVEMSGGDVSLSTGSYDNIKVTTLLDLEIARILIKNRGGIL